MKVVKSVLVSRIRHFLRSLRKVGFSLALLVSGITPFVHAETIPQPLISILTLDVLVAPLVAAPVFAWRTDLARPLEFIATITRSDISPVDVYFGVIIPGGRVFSWIPGTANGPVLVEGLSPAGRGITAAAISGAGLLGSDPQNLFSASQPIGLYSLFVVLVRSGADASNPGNWFGAAMSPLIISN